MGRIPMWMAQEFRLGVPTVKVMPFHPAKKRFLLYTVESWKMLEDLAISCWPKRSDSKFCRDFKRAFEGAQFLVPALCNDRGRLDEVVEPKIVVVDIGLGRRHRCILLLLVPLLTTTDNDDDDDDVLSLETKWKGPRKASSRESSRKNAPSR